jgi:hypothetical protein
MSGEGNRRGRGLDLWADLTRHPVLGTYEACSKRSNLAVSASHPRSEAPLSHGAGRQIVHFFVDGFSKFG